MTSKTLKELITGPVTTNDAVLQVKMTNDAKLAVGGHSFELQTEDDSGNVSQPTRVLVIVVDTQAPTAVLQVRDEQGVPLPNNTVQFGKGLILDGKKSFDVGGGKIVKYTWSLVD